MFAKITHSTLGYDTRAVFSYLAVNLSLPKSRRGVDAFFGQGNPPVFGKGPVHPGTNARHL
ncbi:hypothetical protein [Roseibium sp.]|uniref:hypothetical protein n=1 Tax=Roseibium sp. TaxID=1936156 RepID=UPI003265EFAF